MRVVREVEHTRCKITIFSWSLKFLIKLEKGPYEQTFKISELDVAESELDDILSDDFINDAINRFDSMHASLQKHLF